MSLVINFLTGAPRDPVPVAPEPPAKGDGRFGNLLSDLWEREGQAGGFLGDVSSPAADEQQGAGNAVADVFNQHGLLARDKGATVPTLASAAPVPAATVGMPVAAEAAATGSGQLCSVATTLSMASNSPPHPGAAPLPLPPAVSGVSALASSLVAGVGRTVVDVAPVQAGQAVRTPAFSPKPTVQAIVRGFSAVEVNPTGVEDSQPGLAQAGRRDVSEGSLISDSQLTLHMGEQGATIVGRALAGEKAGRARLRDRIAALLSRYGLRTHDIRLNGVPLLHATDPRREEL